MTKFVAIVSGKGGAGKTTTAINLCQALTELGKNSIVLDANLATPDLALHLGSINPKNTLNQFLRLERELHEVICRHESGISYIPASPSYSEFKRSDYKKLPEMFEHLDDSAELVLVDSPSGLGSEVSEILKNTDEALIVVNPYLSSVIDALKTIQLAEESNNIITGIILNMSNKEHQELKKTEIEKMLGRPIIGNVKFNKKMKKSLHKNMPMNYLYPRSEAAREYRKIANCICQNEKN